MQCPSCEFETESLRGMSRHYGARHGVALSVSQKQELLASVSSDAGSASTGFGSFEEAANAAPESDVEPRDSGKATRKPRTPRKPSEAELRLAAMRKSVGEACGRLTLVFLSQWLGFSFSAEDSEKIREGWLAFFEAVGITLNIERLNYEVKSAWFLLLLPIASIAMVLGNHIGEISASLKERGKEKK